MVPDISGTIVSGKCGHIKKFKGLFGRADIFLAADLHHGPEKIFTGNKIVNGVHDG